ncbi:TPA: hypothetical protein QDE50_36975 [Burkholderia cenocepacia]|nr:hypothetical protein [Burkholderia cenocepacia]HDR9889946.1 hypothetical protein [Burkholderia cenocepacia]
MITDHEISNFKIPLSSPFAAIFIVLHLVAPTLIIIAAAADSLKVDEGNTLTPSIGVDALQPWQRLQ